ncbi:MAG: hypothetical protein ACTSPI_13565 [Candidatus Heimdallarchaeaceae archaeon]
MADNVEIIRPATTDERKDFIDITRGESNAKKAFIKRLREKELECTKKHIPFDWPCAWADFNDRYEQAMVEVSRRSEFKDTDADFKIVDIKDLDQYADPKRFVKVAEKENLEPKLVDGMRVPIAVSMTIDYKCKKRGHGISVAIPMDEYNRQKKSKTEKKVDKK